MRHIETRVLALVACLAAALAIVPAPVVGASQTTSTSPFAPRPAPDLVVPDLPDEELGSLLSALDASVTDVASEPAVGTDQARSTLWSFARRLQSVRLTGDQETRVLTHLDRVGLSHPALAGALDEPRRMLTRLTVGKTAPEITGRDLDGAELRLTDYRDRVVVLVFSASWCAICKSQYPYQRFLQELYEGWPFAILGIDGSASAETALAAKADHGLTYRSWWDAPTEDAPEGPIAQAWNVRGRPTIYVLDGNGVIRFVDLRHEDLLKGVRQLLHEHMLAVDRTRLGRAGR